MQKQIAKQRRLETIQQAKEVKLKAETEKQEHSLRLENTVIPKVKRILLANGIIFSDDEIAYFIKENSTWLSKKENLNQTAQLIAKFMRCADELKKI